MFSSANSFINSSYCLISLGYRLESLVNDVSPPKGCHQEVLDAILEFRSWICFWDGNKSKVLEEAVASSLIFEVDLGIIEGGGLTSTPKLHITSSFSPHLCGLLEFLKVCGMVIFSAGWYHW